MRGFKGLLERAMRGKSGTTFLIQGAPGVGKSALLYELERLALASGWETTKKKLYPPALWNPNELRSSIGKRTIPRITSGSAQVNLAGLAKAGVTAEWVQSTTLNVLSSGKEPLLLKLDEAQTLGTTNAPPSNLESAVTNVLDAIHNGELARPVILLAAGLGMTSEVFKSLGISRFAEECKINLGALSKEAERAVLQDWLKKEGGAKGDPTAWIDAIADKAHGWPQHIVSYANTAAKQIVKDGGDMTPEGLEAVFEVGMERREKYYEQRAEGFSRKERLSLAKLIGSVSPGEGLDKEDILSSLSQKYGPNKAEKLFHLALQNGILHSYKGVYVIPIPSMHNWLMCNYAPEKIEFPRKPQMSRS